MGTTRPTGARATEGGHGPSSLILGKTREDSIQRKWGDIRKEPPGWCTVALAGVV